MEDLTNLTQFDYPKIGIKRDLIINSGPNLFPNRDRINATVSSKSIDSMLGPYDPNCRYFKDAQMSFNHPLQFEHRSLEITAEMSIPYCYYAKDKASAPEHFNATDFILCFNQLSYVLVAEAIEKGLLPELEMKNTEDLLNAQMNRCYISTYKDITFKKPIIPSKFTGQVSINSVKNIGRTVVFMPSSVIFKDSNRGLATGKCLLSVVSAHT